MSNNDECPRPPDHPEGRHWGSCNCDPANYPGPPPDLRQEDSEEPCQVVLADFAFGPVRCNEPAPFTIEQDGERWRLCPDHALYGTDA